MFLSKLTITKDGEIVREIPFHPGINLIIDETDPENRKGSGNSVGKTTVLKLIDFCLGGDGKNIYIDPEFGRPNEKVKKFLIENNVVISLELVSRLNSETAPSVVIEKNFLVRKDKIQRINGVQYTNKKIFEKELKKLIFHSSSEKPSFRQIISKNIRDEKNKLVHTIKVLTPNVTTDATYESLYLFWLGIDEGISKDRLIRARNTEKKLQARLREEGTPSKIKQSLIIVNKEIQNLEDKRKGLTSEEYQNDFAELSRIQSQLNVTSSLLSRMQMREELILESQRDLDEDVSNIDTRKIEALYKKAKAFIPAIQKTFEETLEFHNSMVKQKIRFITEELPELKRKILEASHEMKTLLLEEERLKGRLKKAGILEGLESIVSKLNDFYEKKGQLEEQERLWETTEGKLKEIDNQLDVINRKISEKDVLIQERIEIFNSYFSKISSELDGVHSVLSADKEADSDFYKFAIDNVERNPGTGGKKSQMASFDLAYILFADELKIPCLHFILQDQIENVHANQITTLLCDIVGQVNCQYVLPVLRDKLPLSIDVAALEILSLSQENKLFKL